jgi:hypothetical protein
MEIIFNCDSFFPTVLDLWNKLDNDTRNIQSLSSFKIKLNEDVDKSPSFYSIGSRRTMDKHKNNGNYFQLHPHSHTGSCRTDEAETSGDLSCLLHFEVGKLILMFKALEGELPNYIKNNIISYINIEPNYMVRDLKLPK